MAKKITDEEIILINELYLELGVKARVAERVGRSASTVSKYIIKDYVSQKEQPKIENFDSNLIIPIDSITFDNYEEFAKSCRLTENEWEALKEIQKGVFI